MMIGNFYRLKNIIPLFFLGAVLVSSCSSRKDVLFNTGKEKDIPKVPVYVLQKGDLQKESQHNIILPGQQLLIINLQNEDLINGLGNAQNSTPMQYDVAPDSTINLPVLGKTKIGGLSRTEAELMLNKLYKASLLKDPLFKITINNMRVTLLGEFMKQGNYILPKDKTNLIEILGEAGGLTLRANKKKLKIIRGDLHKPQVFMVNLEDINSLADSRLNLRDGDILYIEPKGLYKTTDKISPVVSYVGIGTALVNIIFLMLNSR